MAVDPFRVVRDFESALCEYTGAPYAVTVNSCTMALLLAVAWHLRNQPHVVMQSDPRVVYKIARPAIEIPKRTYVSVPQSIIHAGGRPTFRDENWSGIYQLKPLPVWDSARLFTSKIYQGVHVSYLGGTLGPPLTIYSGGAGQMLCLSFHWSKTLGIQQGGAILHDDPEADVWLRRARFDGRTEGIPPKDDDIMLGWHCYMSPEIAAQGLVRLAFLPKKNSPLQNDDYPDLSQMDCFK